jgi:hypothetical protein
MTKEALKSQKKSIFISRIFKALTSRRFKRAFVNGFKGVSLSFLLMFFLRKVKSVAANDSPDVPFNRLPLEIIEIEPKRTWHKFLGLFLNLEFAGKALGALTGLLLLRAVLALDAQIKETKASNLELARAREYIETLVRACKFWKDPGSY